MLRVARWCIGHRRHVLIGWIVIAVLCTALAQAAGRHYTTSFSLPGTESQRALDLLKQHFRAQSGDIDTIVFQTTEGNVFSPSIQRPVARLLARVQTMPHVVAVISPYGRRGAFQVSADRKTAFAQIYYDKTQNLLPTNTGQPVLDAVHSFHVNGLKLAAGGAVIENAEGFSIGPATAVGVVAALVILLLTFGSLLAAGMPLITAAFGLITGVAVIGLATHLVHMPNVSTDLALMIGLGVGIDYALFIVTRFRESHSRVGDVSAATVEAMDTSGRAILLAGTTVVIALLGMFVTGVNFMYGLSVASVIAVLLTMLASLTLLPALLSRFGERLVRPGRLRRRSLSPRPSLWLRWSEIVQSHPWPLALVTVLAMLALLFPVFGLRLANSDAGNDATSQSTRQAYDMLARGFGPG